MMLDNRADYGLVTSFTTGGPSSCSRPRVEPAHERVGRARTAVAALEEAIARVGPIPPAWDTMIRTLGLARPRLLNGRSIGSFGRRGVLPTVCQKCGYPGSTEASGGT